MKNLNKIMLIAALAVNTLVINGQGTTFIPSGDPDGISRQIVESNAKLQSLQCDFNQEKELSFLEEKAFSSGKFYFQKADKIRWEYEKPYQYIIILNGSMVKILDEGRSNTLDASSNRLFSSINSVMTGIIDGSVIQRQDQFKSRFLESEQAVRIVLEPVIQGMKEFIASIELDINKQDYSVDALKIIEKTGDYTLIRFNNKKFNAKIPEDIFNTH